MKWIDYKNEILNDDKNLENYYILGIDLGTTNSIISYWDSINKRPEPIDISNGFGKIPMPSVVQYRNEDDAEEWVIGEEAYRSMKLYPETTIRSIKRKMGTNEKIKVGKKSYLPEEISAKILMELIEHCKNLNPNSQIAGLVVSVPYDFDDAAKRATMKACEEAGLKDKLICLIEEPKAAALAYNFRHTLNQDETIMVFDFGGGTLDITLFKVMEKDEKHIKLQVISEGGKAYHGGDNIDETILKKCYEFIQKKIDKKIEDLTGENTIELICRARECKERLSGVKSFRIPFTFCIPPFVEQITRDDLENLIEPFIEETKKLVLKSLREVYKGAITADSVDRILLEGGSAQMPWVKDMLISIFNDESKIYQSERPALDISLGATYYAAMKMGLLSSQDIESEKASIEFEVTVPHDIGLEVENNKSKSFYTMIRRGTPYSLAKKEQVFTLSGDKAIDMTNFNLKIMERINKGDDIQKCKLIGEVLIKDLPQRPSGKTRLSIELQVDEEGGLVKGNITDLGFLEEFEPSGFNERFDPSRFNKTILEG